VNRPMEMIEATANKLQGICQVPNWVFATAQRLKSMFRRRWLPTFGHEMI
jgi:hypothetical protein